MESQVNNGVETEEIDIVELGSASELIQENAPRGPLENTCAPGRWWQPLYIFEDEKE